MQQRVRVGHLDHVRGDLVALPTGEIAIMAVSAADHQALQHLVAWQYPQPHSPAAAAQVLDGLPRILTGQTWAADITDRVDVPAIDTLVA